MECARAEKLAAAPQVVMTGTRYLVRFDDICSTMNWAVWAEIESCLRAFGIKPILAVVPKNRDTKLIADVDRRDFWERVREWQALGWSIGLHGYEHRRVSEDGGIVDINPKSEFAGVAYETQLGNLTRALEIFRAEGVKPDVWVAPWHSFDANTLKALATLGLGCVSDGFATTPYRDANGMVWVPQQLWRFRRMPPGTWTVCHHHNHWTRAELDRFLSDIARHSPRITGLQGVVDTVRLDRSFFELLTAQALHRLIRSRQRLVRPAADPNADVNRYLE